MASPSRQEEYKLLQEAVASRTFAKKYKRPFLKQLVKQSHGQRLSSSMICRKFVEYLKTKCYKKISVRLNEILISKTHKTTMFNLYKYYCGKRIFEQMDEYDKHKVDAWSLTCLKLIRGFRRVENGHVTTVNADELIVLSSEEYVKKLKYKLTSKQYDLFKNKCIKEGSFFKWNTVKYMNTYYVQQA